MGNLIEQASKLGRKAFEDGLGQAPMHNPEFIKLMDGFAVGEGVPLCKAYLDAWHQACDESLFN
jgi:hypothetical protein